MFFFCFFFKSKKVAKFACKEPFFGLSKADFPSFLRTKNPKIWLILGRFRGLLKANFSAFFRTKYPKIWLKLFVRSRFGGLLLAN